MFYSKLRFILFLGYSILLCSCFNNSDQDISAPNGSLAELMVNTDFVRDNVIACASGSSNKNEIIAYLYPRPNATDIRYFETENSNIDKNDYTAYKHIELVPTGFFNGYLLKLTRITVEEKWIIITFIEDEKLHLSNPIRLKHQTQNTIFTDQITVTENNTGNASFFWNEITNPLDKIYFQVVSDSTDELLSGTYTFEANFKYYDTSNVVLNITRNTPPPNLISNETYNYTLMGVSEDNWVNVFGQKSFVGLP